MIAYTALWNVTGNPAASVPAGIAEDGLPLACQLVGRRGRRDHAAQPVRPDRGGPTVVDAALTGRRRGRSA